MSPIVPPQARETRLEKSKISQRQSQTLLCNQESIPTVQVAAIEATVYDNIHSR